jgi:hypothetical protein
MAEIPFFDVKLHTGISWLRCLPAHAFLTVLNFPFTLRTRNYGAHWKVWPAEKKGTQETASWKRRERRRCVIIQRGPPCEGAHKPHSSERNGKQLTPSSFTFCSDDNPLQPEELQRTVQCDGKQNLDGAIIRVMKARKLLMYRDDTCDH